MTSMTNVTWLFVCVQFHEQTFANLPCDKMKVEKIPQQSHLCYWKNLNQETLWCNYCPLSEYIYIYMCVGERYDWWHDYVLYFNLLSRDHSFDSFQKIADKRMKLSYRLNGFIQLIHSTSYSRKFIAQKKCAKCIFKFFI